MKLDLSLQEFYPHPIEKVWAAITDRAALAVWLMANDFELRVGKRFRFWNEPRKPQWRGWIDCEVLVSEPPARMVWSWLNSDDGMPTRVEIRLEAVTGGTRMTLEHTGETDPTQGGYASGWLRKLAELRVDLAR